jgi:hypothetical protein
MASPILGVSVFPTSAVADVTGGITTAISDNILVILGILSFMVGLRIVFGLFNKQVSKKVG